MRKIEYDLQRFAVSYGLGTQKSAANLDVGAGEYSFMNFDADANPNQTFMSLGNCSAATLAWSVNSIVKRDATRGTREKIAECETQRDADLTITMDESDPIKYALAMYGQTAIKKIEAKDIAQQFTVSPGDEIFITVDGSTAAYNYTDLIITRIAVTPASVSTAKLDQQGGMTASAGTVTSGGSYTGNSKEDYYVKISKANTAPQTITDAQFVWKKGLAGTYSTEPITITGEAQTIDAGITVKFAAATTGQDLVLNDVWKITATPAGGALELGKDYSADSVDIRNGKVRFPLDSSIGLNEKVNVNCKVAEQYIPRIYAGVKKKIEGMLRFEYDPTHGRQKAITFYHVSISPNGDDSMIGEDWGSRQIKASVLSDSSHADPDNPDSRYFRVDYPGDVNGVLVKRGQ